MDWNENPTQAGIYSVGAMVATVIIWILLYGLYWIRRAIYNSCYPHNTAYEEHRMVEEGQRQPKGEVNEAMETGEN